MKQRITRTVIGVTLLLAMVTVQAGVVESLQQAYQGSGADNFTAQAGSRLWNGSYRSPKDGQARQCGSCHGPDLTATGKHQRTGKLIEPMAPSVNSQRPTDRKKVEKWLKRNCKWTLGRECNAQEKGDLLAFLIQQ